MLEWNGYPLKGRTFEEVYDIICESRADHDVEIIVSRPISDVGRPSSIGNSANMTPHGYLPQSASTRSGGSKVRDRPAVKVTSPTSPDTIHPSWGKVHVQYRLYMRAINFLAIQYRLAYLVSVLFYLFLFLNRNQLASFTVQYSISHTPS